MLRLIAFYRRWISPLLPPRCRFVPSCSEYAAEAIESYGTTRGSWLAAKRVCRCHPFHPGGFDPVPQKVSQCTEHSMNSEQSDTAKGSIHSSEQSNQ